MPWKYTALVIRLLGIEGLWGNAHFFEYVDRWVSNGVWSMPDKCAPYSGKKNDFGKTYGSISRGKCVEGGGRSISKHGKYSDGGYYRSKLGDRIWTKLRAEL